MTSKEKRFVELVLSGEAACRAYVLAGWKARGDAARVGASKVMRRRHVSEWMKQERRRMAEAHQIHVTEVLAYLRDVIFTSISDVDGSSPLVEIEDHSSPAEGVARYRRVMVSKLQAVALLSRLMGWTATPKKPEAEGDGFEILLGMIHADPSPVQSVR